MLVFFPLKTFFFLNRKKSGFVFCENMLQAYQINVYYVLLVEVHTIVYVIAQAGINLPVLS